MSRIERLVRRLISLPADMLCSEVEAVLGHFGWTLRRTRGSHRIYGDDGRRMVIATHGRKLKRSYLAEIVRILGLKTGEQHEE